MDKELKERLDKLSERQIVIETKITELYDRILKIEDTNKWLCRTVLGAFILGVIALLIGG